MCLLDFAKDKTRPVNPGEHEWCAFAGVPPRSSTFQSLFFFAHVESCIDLEYSTNTFCWIYPMCTRHPSLKPLLFTWGHGSDRGFLRGFGSSSLRPRWWRQRDRWEDLAPTADAFTMVLAREIQDVSTRSNYQPFSFDQLRIEGILQGLF